MAGNTSSRDEDADYRRHYQGLLTGKNYSAFDQELLKAVRENRVNNVKTLLELAEQSEWRELRSYPKLLRIAIQFTANGYETFELIAEKYPDLLTKRLGESIASILDIAVARENVKGARLILQKCIQPETSPINAGASSSPKIQKADIPILIAAWNHDVEMIDLLISYGADITQRGSSEENVFHHMVQGAVNLQKKLDLIKLQETFTRLMKAATEAGHSDLIRQKDKCDDTALIYSIAGGSSEMFKLIINSVEYKRLDIECNPIEDIYLYDVTEIDYALSDNRPSAMRLLKTLSYIHPTKCYGFMKIPPVSNLISTRWSECFWKYLLWALCHYVLMLGYTYSYNISGTVVFEVLLAIYSLLILTPHISQLVLDCNYYLVGLFYEPHKVLMVLLGVCSIATVIARVASSNDGVVYTRAIAVIVGWAYSASFTRMAKPMCLFTVMVKYAVSDLLYFWYVCLVSLIAYSATLEMLLNASPELNDKFNTTAEATNTTAEATTADVGLFTTFLLSIGLDNLDNFDDIRYPNYTRTIYFIFMMTTYIILLNMLIGVLSGTCAEVLACGRDQWYELQKLGIILDMHLISDTFRRIRNCRARSIEPSHEEEDIPRQTNKHFCEVRASTPPAEYVSIIEANTFEEAFISRQSDQDSINSNGTWMVMMVKVCGANACDITARDKP